MGTSTSTGSQFPTQGINPGHIHHNPNTGLTYMYIGGDAGLATNWKTVSITSDYTGRTGQSIRVNATEDGLEFFVPAHSEFLDGREQAVTCADSVTVNWNNGATAYMVFDRATVAITLSNGNNGKVYRLRLTQDATGSRIVTWSTTVKWRGGSAPTLTTTANKSDWITLVYSNSEWYGDITLKF